MNDKVRYARVSGTDIKQMRESLPDELWNAGDAILVWVNEGDIYQHGALVEMRKEHMDNKCPLCGNDRANHYYTCALA